MVPEDETYQTTECCRTDKVGCESLNLPTDLSDQHQLWCHCDNINVQGGCPQCVKHRTIVEIWMYQNCKNEAAQSNVLNFDVVMLFLVCAPMRPEDAVEDIE